MTIKALYPTVEPSLNLDFANTKRLDPRITFTRASTATFVGDNGLIQSAAVNVARFDHNPATGESLGLLVEEARTNLLLRSEEFGTTWGTSPATISSNVVTAPDGTTTADKLVTSNTTDQQRTFQSATVAAGTVTFSVYAKAAGFSYMRLESGSSLEIANFDLTQGVLGTVSGAATITKLSNGWYRCSMPITTSAGANDFRIYVIGSATDGRGSTLAGNGVDGIYIWGAQLEAGDFPTSYIPTVASTVTRAADVASITGTNFSSWYRQDEGTVIASVKNMPVTSAVYIADIGANATSGSGASGHAIYATSTIAGGFTQASNVAVADVSSTYSVNTVNAAYAYKVNNFSFALNNVLGTPDTSGAIPVLGAQQVFIGARFNGTQAVNKPIARLAYYPVRLPDAQLQALTAT